MEPVAKRRAEYHSMRQRSKATHARRPRQKIGSVRNVERQPGREETAAGEDRLLAAALSLGALRPAAGAAGLGMVWGAGAGAGRRAMLRSAAPARTQRSPPQLRPRTPPRRKRPKLPIGKDQNGRRIPIRAIVPVHMERFGDSESLRALPISNYL